MSNVPEPDDAPQSWLKKNAKQLLLVLSVCIAVFSSFLIKAFIKEKKAEAVKEEVLSVQHQLVNAILAYQKKYGHLPLPISCTKGTDCESDTGPEEGLISMLAGLDPEHNPEKIDFLSALPKAKELPNDNYADGLARIKVSDDIIVGLYDPWGNTYRVSLDLDSDGFVANPDQDDAKITRLKEQVIVWSFGKDRQSYTWRDNLVSWPASTP